jgi:hypothetical protein
MDEGACKVPCWTCIWGCLFGHLGQIYLLEHSVCTWPNWKRLAHSTGVGLGGWDDSQLQSRPKFRGFLLDGYQSNNGCQGICLLPYYSPYTRQDISLFVQPTIQMFPCFPLNSIQLVKSWLAARMRRRGNEMQNVEQRCDKVKR